MSGHAPAQLGLFGAARPRAAPSARPHSAALSVVYYFAVLPPENVRLDLLRLRQQTVSEERIFGRPVAPERLHISIAPFMRCSPTDVPDFVTDVEPRTDEILSHVTMSAFELSFDRLQTFITKDHDAAHRRYYLVLSGSDLPGLMRLNDLFRRSHVRCGLGPRMRDIFNPHLTLFYANHPIAPRDIAPIRWTVRDVALVQSFHGAGRYVILKRWPLPG